MPLIYPKKWYLVPHEEYPASTLPLGRLVGGINEISHPLNRKTLVIPPLTDIIETTQTNFDVTIFQNSKIHGGADASSPFSPFSLEGSGGVNGDNKNTVSVDVVQTQILRPSDEYAKECFNASRGETEMANYLKNLPWNRNVFMITGRKVGRAITINRDEKASIEQKAKIGLNIQQTVNLGANLDMNWKKGLKIGSLTDKEPCVFAVQLKRVNYHGNPAKPVTTKDYVKNAVFGRDDEDKEEEEEEEDQEYVADGIIDEGPRVDKYDYDSVRMAGPEGEEEFMVRTED